LETDLNFELFPFGVLLLDTIVFGVYTPKKG